MGGLFLFSYRDFYPRPPRGGRRRCVRSREGRTIFLSTPSARRATDVVADLFPLHGNFYPRPPRGGRLGILRAILWAAKFLSTPSARRATHPCVGCAADYPISIHALREEGDNLSIQLFDSLKEFLSTPSARRATQDRHQPHVAHQISIHALREEGDGTGGPAGSRPENFYPRPPRGGRRGVVVDGVGLTVFLSTPSARRATHHRHQL